MNPSAPTYGVKVVRGPFVTIPPHPRAVESSAELIERVSSQRGSRPLAVDLFCGAGGLSIGLADAGYDVVLGVDDDPLALETYGGLHAGLTLCRDLGDPEAVDEVSGLISELNVDIIAGGPPCQPFSRAGAAKIRSLVEAGARPAYDNRRDLWQSFLEIVQQAQPSAVLLENVPDMAIAADTSIVRTIVGELEADGYAVHTILLHSCEHGVPQFRQRFFLVALADGAGFNWPAPLTDVVTVGDAIGDLPPVTAGWRSPRGADGYLAYKNFPKPYSFAHRARIGLQDEDIFRIYDHITRPVRDDDQLIFESMDSSTLYSEIDDSLKRYRDDIFNDKYKRLSWEKPSRSITAHIARDGYWYIHPEQTRTLTIREAARLQTFPDRIRFAGPPSSAFRQIGNAVPPLLAECVARSIHQALRLKNPARPTSAEFSERITTWYERKGRLSLPWLDAPTVWSAVQGQLLLDRVNVDLLEEAWPTIEKFESPDHTIESASCLRNLSEVLGREKRAEKILDAANWYVENPDALATAEGLQGAPHVGSRTAEVAVLVNPNAGPTPVVVNQGSLRVAARVLGLPLIQRRRSRSDGRLGITRLLPGGQGKWNDTSRVAMAGVLELAASICKPKDPQCWQCPLVEKCNWATRNAAVSSPDISSPVVSKGN